MKTVMILAISQKVCNVRLFPIGMMIGRGACFVMAALASLLMTGALRADTHYVNVARPDDSGDGLSWATAEKTIQAAITASTAGDTIVVTNGVYASITTTNNSITIQSFNGATFTIIDGGGTNRCATLGDLSNQTNTVLVGFTLRNGSAYYGGGSYYGTLSNCILTTNRASFGGGSFDGTLNNCIVTGNSVSCYGGGSFDGTLNNCTLSENSADDGGGSCYGTLNNCTLSGNTAFTYGGGSREGTLNNCTLSGNNSFYCGGGSVDGTLNNCTLTGNSASVYGGGSDWGTLNNCKLTWNSASFSGGGSAWSTLNNCTLSGNSASGDGGGSYYGTLNNCTLTGNSAYSGGGAYYGTLNNCTLTGNSASSEGGGSYDCILYNCMLTGNSAYSGGGANCGTLNNCTLTGNSASYGGGGVYGSTLNSCTLTGNSASDSGGGSYGGTLNNCIVWGNTLFSGVTNNYDSGTFSYSCTTPLPSGTGNISVDPLFKDSINNNYLLRVGSPCINTGSNAFVVGSTDLAGNPRIVDGRVDMGAYEMPPMVTVTFDANGGLLATGQAVTNRVGFTGDLYDSWLSISNGISRVGYTFTGWFTASIGGTPVLSTHSITGGLVYAQWIPAPPIIPGNPNVASNFLDNVTQAQVDALVAGLRMAHPDVTDAEIAKKFEDADLFGFTGADLVGVGSDALARLNPSILLVTISVVEGDPRTLVVAVTIGNNIDPTPALALVRLGEAINSRMRGVFKGSLSAGESETILTPALSLDHATGVVTATFTLEDPSATSGFLRMSLRK